MSLSSVAFRMATPSVRTGLPLTLSLVIFFMFIRWTIPRFRFDQLMGLAWKTLLPLSLANLLCAIVVKKFGLGTWLLLPMSLGLFAIAGLVHARSAQVGLSRPRRANLQPAMGA